MSLGFGRSCLPRDTPQHPPPTPARDRGGRPQWSVQRGVDGWDARPGARYEGTQPLREGGHVSGTPHGQGVGLRASAPGRVWTGGVLQAVSALRTGGKDGAAFGEEHRRGLQGGAGRPPLRSRASRDGLPVDVRLDERRGQSSGEHGDRAGATAARSAKVNSGKRRGEEPPMTNDALIEEINSAYRRLKAATEGLASADRELAKHIKRVRLDNAEAILEAKNERTATLYLDGLLDTEEHRRLEDIRARTDLDFQHARREVDRLHLIVRLLGTQASEGIER